MVYMLHVNWDSTENLKHFSNSATFQFVIRISERQHDIVLSHTGLTHMNNILVQFCCANFTRMCDWLRPRQHGSLQWKWSITGLFSESWLEKMAWSSPPEQRKTADWSMKTCCLAQSR